MNENVAICNLKPIKGVQKFILEKNYYSKRRSNYKLSKNEWPKRLWSRVRMTGSAGGNMATGDAKDSKEIPPGTRVVCTTYFDENIEGEVVAFDYGAKLLIISILFSLIACFYFFRGNVLPLSGVSWCGKLAKRSWAAIFTPSIKMLNLAKQDLLFCVISKFVQYLHCFYMC